MNFIESLIHGWQDVAVIAVCFVMVYALPFRFIEKRVQSTEQEKEHDNSSH